MTIVKSQIRRGFISEMPILDAGELGLALDENRVFVGTDPIAGSLNTSESDTFVAVVSFFTNLNGNISAIDLDNASEYSYEIYINGVQATQFAVDDHIVRIVHNLGRLPDANDEFVLRLNQELTTDVTSEGNKNSVQYIQFQNLSGTPTQTGISIDSSVKTSVTIDYYMYSNNMSRNGQLRISVNPTLSPPATITDMYDQTGTSDLTFSIDGNELMFVTTDTSDHEFTYKQTSFAKRPVI